MCVLFVFFPRNEAHKLFLGCQNGAVWVGGKKFMLKMFMCFFCPLLLQKSFFNKLFTVLQNSGPVLWRPASFLPVVKNWIYVWNCVWNSGRKQLNRVLTFRKPFGAFFVSLSFHFSFWNSTFFRAISFCRGATLRIFNRNASGEDKSGRALNGTCLMARAGRSEKQQKTAKKCEKLHSRNSGIS